MKVVLDTNMLIDTPGSTREIGVYEGFVTALSYAELAFGLAPVPWNTPASRSPGAKAHNPAHHRSRRGERACPLSSSGALGPEMDVLEVATGTGLVALAIADAARSVTATDFSDKMVGIAQPKPAPANGFAVDRWQVLKAAFPLVYPEARAFGGPQL
jgi:SAM-dependent methyltransferase